MTETARRERFTSSLGVLLTMIGVAVGLGNVWRFPYMVGHFGGAAFVLLYVVMVAGIGVPALMAEWALGRHTRRGTVGAFEKAGLPAGRLVGWFFFFVVTAATAYYTNVVGWVLYHALGQVLRAVRPTFTSSAILPPPSGLSATAMALQAACTALVIAACAMVLLRGLKSGIESASRVIMPVLLVVLLVVTARSVSLPGSLAGLRWYILKLDLAALSPDVALAAMGQAVFSLSLGGTFMVVYGSYLREDENLARGATLTAAGDTLAGLLAGVAIFPAVFAFGMEPSAGPSLLFSTLPAVFDAIPLGWAFGLVFFLGLFGAAYLSDVAAFEVLVTGLTDNTRISRSRAIWLMAGTVFVFSLPSMVNTRVFVPWDLTFGSGMQTLGSLLAVVSVGWALDRSAALRALSREGSGPAPSWLYYWVRFVIPGAILLVGLWWVLTQFPGLRAVL